MGTVNNVTNYYDSDAWSNVCEDCCGYEFYALCRGGMFACKFPAVNNKEVWGESNDKNLRWD